eukprot:TRINITY_DN3493_c0_g1_i2.p1 TRINITY_DN3493_c0_g1~~TRINITY_DN3493_c0_g1_i2.p1  ORF type:complete len:157 (-),score=29.10 TRINITY_DN3493_c0_g1_i2:43-513(-)
MRFSVAYSKLDLSDSPTVNKRSFDQPATNNKPLNRPTTPQAKSANAPTKAVSTSPKPANAPTKISAKATPPPPPNNKANLVKSNPGVPKGRGPLPEPTGAPTYVNKLNRVGPSVPTPGNAKVNALRTSFTRETVPSDMTPPNNVRNLTKNYNREYV